MLIRVLGPLRIERDGTMLELRSRRQRAVLAHLAARPGRVVGSEQLIDAVWGEHPPKSAAAALQVHIGDLRNAIEPDRPSRTSGTYVLTRSGGYVLDVGPEDLDGARFEQLVATSRASARAGDHAAAALGCATALALWRGEAFADCREVVSAHATWLDALRLDVEDDLAAAELALGNHEAVAANLERLVEAQPLRERRVELAMTALYRSGRQHEAITLFQRTRTRMVEELGLEPGPRLVALERDIVAHRLAVGGSPIVVAPPPGAPLRLIGRDHQRATLADLVASHPLVTVTGPPGVGKSSLVRCLPAALGDRTSWVIDLTAVAHPDHLRSSVIDAVGVRERAFTDPLSDVAAVVSGGVVILDDHDRVSEATASLAVWLLAHARDLRIVTTGRQALGLVDERPFSLAPLSTVPCPDGGRSPAVQLLAARAGPAVDQVDDADLDALAHRLDGIPLALELAAARLAALSPAELVGRLASSPALLARAAPEGPAHHRSLSDAIAWSHELLDEDARSVLDACSVFAAPFTLEAAERVCRPLVAAEAVAPAIVELVSRSFLAVADDGPRRTYRPYAAVRDFARHRLAASGHAEVVAEAHAHHVSSLISSTAIGAGGVRLADARAVLERSLPDLRRALDWFEAERDAGAHHRAVAPLVVFWFSTGRFAEGRERLERAAARPSDASPEGVADHLDALAAAAVLAFFGSDFAAARRHLRAGVAISEGGDEHEGIEAARALLAWMGGDHDEAQARATRALELVRRRGDDWRLCRTLVIAGHVSWFAGDDAAARDRYEECAEVAARIDNDFFAGIALRGASLALVRTGRPEAAQRRSAESLALADALGDATNRGQSLTFAGLVDLAAAPDLVAGRTIDRLVEGIRLAGRTLDVFCLLLGAAGLAEVAHRRGEDERATVLWSWVDVMSTMAGIALPPFERARCRAALDAAARHLGPEAFDDARRRGRQMSPPALAAYASAGSASPAPRGCGTTLPF